MGARAEYFSPKKGLRQGDPISPYLFIICMDKLSHIINDVVEGGRWKALNYMHIGTPYCHHCGNIVELKQLFMFLEIVPWL
jgi:hypothetical protein